MSSKGRRSKLRHQQWRQERWKSNGREPQESNVDEVQILPLDEQGEPEGTIATPQDIQNRLQAQDRRAWRILQTEGSLPKPWRDYVNHRTSRV